MTDPDTDTLDSFETALLAELRTVVAERPAATPAPRGRGRRRVVYAGLAAAAAAGIAVVALPGAGTQPAYAITVDGDGQVHVRVHSLSDAAGLEQALEEQGIAADVTYLADDTECAADRYQHAPDATGDFRITMGEGYGYAIDMDAGLIRDGETLVISAARISATGSPGGEGPVTDGGSTVSVGVAVGDVGPCVPVPHTEPSRGGPGTLTSTRDEGTGSRAG